MPQLGFARVAFGEIAGIAWIMLSQHAILKFGKHELCRVSFSISAKVYRGRKRAPIVDERMAA